MTTVTTCGLSVITGRVLRVGDDISTDLIYPARFMPLRSASEQAAHVFAGLDEAIAGRVASCAMVVAGWNMGCGSSREQAVTALTAAGIRLVIARSFSRLYFRNCINTGMPAIESSALVDALRDGDEATVDLDSGHVMIAGRRLAFPPLPGVLKDIVLQGGLLAQLKRRAQTGDPRLAAGSRHVGIRRDAGHLGDGAP